MMILYTSSTSPFGRKVLICAALTGFREGLEVIAPDLGDPNDEIRRKNPLGKIPTLVLDDGTAYYDSRVIVEYFDHLAGGDVLIPTEREARFRTLTLAALADGILDACVLQFLEERFREAAKREPKWLAHQSEKVSRSLKALEASPPSGRRDISHIGVACALGYLDLRFAGAWRAPIIQVWPTGSPHSALTFLLSRRPPLEIRIRRIPHMTAQPGAARHKN